MKFTIGQTVNTPEGVGKLVHVYKGHRCLRAQVAVKINEQTYATKTFDLSDLVEQELKEALVGEIK